MSNSNSVILAKAGEVVSNPVEFTGVIKKISPMTSKDKAHEGKVWLSFEIEGMPEMTGADGRKVTILRTLAEAKSDLRFFSRPNATLQEVLLSLEGYAKKREVTLNVSAHEAGAIYKVEPTSKYHKNNGGEFNTGDTVTLEKAGFYVDGFLDIDFAKSDVTAKLALIEEASRLAEETAL